MYDENHSLYEWFKRAYGDEKNPVTIIERSANCKIYNGSLVKTTLEEIIVNTF